MLVIDDQKLKLAKMQETLLKVSIDDKQSNLSKYKETVIEIDKEAFDDILKELEKISEHNQTLEDELQFLEQVKDSYNQLLELQLSFTRVCELYDDDSLELSDLSQIAIDYIDNRISTINGYLINLKNIDDNKKKLQELNEQLIEEEKKKRYLNNKMLELDESLRRQFASAEGRIIVDGKSVPSSVVSEYKRIGFDFQKLLENTSELNELLIKVKNENVEIEEKLKTAEVCYNNAPSTDSKQIYDEIVIESLKVKYRLTMLKILELLALNCDSYDMFKEKRENLIDLIKYRLSCLTKLGGVINAC